ncbi:MAG TPA: hypothetical protein VGH42_08855 [Verrucomicrobiae bacterium]
MYQGQKFRSKHEERFAIYLNSLGVSWSYEIHSFSFSGLVYTPDFLIWDLVTFVELKPAECLEEAWKIHELSRERPNHNYLIASMSSFDLKLHEYGKLIDGEVRWFADYEISWVFCRLCCHPYISVDNPDWPLLSCPRCEFDAGGNSFTDRQMTKILSIEKAKRWWKSHRNDPSFPERLIDINYRQCCAGFEGIEDESTDWSEENLIECPF